MYRWKCINVWFDRIFSFDDLRDQKMIAKLEKTERRVRWGNQMIVALLYTDVFVDEKHRRDWAKKFYLFERIDEKRTTLCLDHNCQNHCVTLFVEFFRQMTENKVMIPGVVKHNKRFFKKNISIYSAFFSMYFFKFSPCLKRMHFENLLL